MQRPGNNTAAFGAIANDLCGTKDQFLMQQEAGKMIVFTNVWEVAHGASIVNSPVFPLPKEPNPGSREVNPLRVGCLFSWLVLTFARHLIICCMFSPRLNFCQRRRLREQRDERLSTLREWRHHLQRTIHQEHAWRRRTANSAMRIRIGMWMRQWHVVSLSNQSKLDLGDVLWLVHSVHGQVAIHGSK